MAIKLLVADDHTLFRAGFIALLNGFENVEVIGEANDGDELLKLLRVERPHMILLDIEMPNKDGYEVLEVIKKKYPLVKAIVVSSHDSNSHVLKAIESGACGYIHKNAEPVEIQVAIASVYDTGFYFNDRTNKALLARVVKGNKLVPSFDFKNISLNPLEISILKLICTEYTSAEIGARIGRSDRRVEAIRVEMMQKVGVKNVAGLVVFAISNHIYEV